MTRTQDGEGCTGSTANDGCGSSNTRTRDGGDCTMSSESNCCDSEQQSGTSNDGDSSQSGNNDRDSQSQSGNNDRDATRTQSGGNDRGSFQSGGNGGRTNRGKRRSSTKLCSTTHFYCRDDQTCRPRHLRCSQQPSIDVLDSTCFSKAANNCDHHPPSNTFKVYKGSSVAFRIGITGWFDLIRFYHNQVTFRGLTYEYGKYGLLVHDQNDPKYKYANTKRVKWEYIGLSNCTYDEVMQFADAWVHESDYSAVMHNCQHFATALSGFILGNCAEETATARLAKENDQQLHVPRVRTRPP